MSGTSDDAHNHDPAHLATLFSHLMELGRKEVASEGAASRPTPAAVTPESSCAPSREEDQLNSSPLACRMNSTPMRRGGPATSFYDDLQAVLEWMKHAFEDLRVDAIVISSASTLALQYISNHHGLPSLRKGEHNGGRGRAMNNGDGRQRSIASQDSSSLFIPNAGESHLRRNALQRPRGRGIGILSKDGSVVIPLLSVTCIHLASKYHNVHAQRVANYGTRLNPMRVFQLGFSIAIAMGPALNASFRANPVSLQAVLCAMVKAGPVVRACAEWFALCMTLLPPPSAKISDQQRQTFPPLASRVASPPNNGAMAHGETPREEKRIHLSKAATLALAALALAWRLTRSKGPCLPVQVRALIGLLDNDLLAIALMVEGINVARYYFQTGTGLRSVSGQVDAVIDGKCATPREGRDILGGDIVFGREIEDFLHPEDRNGGSFHGDAKKRSRRIERRTLLDWIVSDSSAEERDNDTPAMCTSPRGGFHPTSAPEIRRAIDFLPTPPPEPRLYDSDAHEARGEGSAEFVRGFQVTAREAAMWTPPDLRYSASSRTDSGRAHSVGSRNSSRSVVDDRSEDGMNGIQRVSRDAWIYSPVSSSSITSCESDYCVDIEENKADRTEGGESYTKMNEDNLLRRVVDEAWRGTAVFSSPGDGSLSPSTATSPYLSTSPSTSRHTNSSMPTSIPGCMHTPMGSTTSSPVFENAGVDLNALRISEDVDRSNRNTYAQTKPSLRLPSPPHAGDAKLIQERDLSRHVDRRDTPRKPAGGKRGSAEQDDDSSGSGKKGGHIAKNKKKKLKATTVSSANTCLSSRGNKMDELHDEELHDMNLCDDELRSRRNVSDDPERKWKVLRERILDVLEYDCGCSFCELHNADGGSVSESTANNVTPTSSVANVTRKTAAMATRCPRR